MIYLIEITNHKRNDLIYYPFVIWYCLDHKINDYVASHIECSYGKIKAVWECDSYVDARNWRAEILKIRGQETLI